MNLPILRYFMGFPGGSLIKNMSAKTGDMGLIPESGRSPGEGNGYPLQYSCLENPMDRGAWRATVRGVTRVRHDWRDLARHSSGWESHWHLIKYDFYFEPLYHFQSFHTEIEVSRMYCSGFKSFKHGDIWPLFNTCASLLPHSRESYMAYL